MISVVEGVLEHEDPETDAGEYSSLATVQSDAQPTSQLHL
jgi:hypothetical protein